ncbi:MAG: hypothetical protein PHO64_11795 [Thiomonas sp.]|nr:hypothetical protein [Thiomonas sp.]
MWDAAMNQEIRAELIKRTRQIGRANGAVFDKRAHGRELARIASKSTDLIAQIEACANEIEDAHDLRFGPHALQIDLRALQEITDRIADTAARVTAEAQARAMRPVRFAVGAWLYIEVILFSGQRPSLYDDGPAVLEFHAVLVEALGDAAPQESAVRKALAGEMEAFDPTRPPEPIRAFLDWARNKI